MKDTKRRLDALKAMARNESSSEWASKISEKHIADAGNHLRLALLHLLAAEHLNGAERIEEIINLLEDPVRDAMH